MFIDVFLYVCHNMIFVILVVILKKEAQLLLKIAEPAYDLLNACLLVYRTVAVRIVPEEFRYRFFAVLQQGDGEKQNITCTVQSLHKVIGMRQKNFAKRIQCLL